MKLLEILKSEKLYAQGMSSVPLYLMACSRSGFAMGTDLGYQYKFFCHTFKQGYGEMLYSESELLRLWQIIKGKLVENPNYLHEVKGLYEKNLIPGNQLLERLRENDLSQLLESELLGVFKECIGAQVNTVGLGHVIEPVGFGLDEELKQKLYQHLPDKKAFNLVYTQITKPTQQSFIGKEQQELEAMVNLEGEELDKALAAHEAKYYWILSNYAGPRRLTKEICLERLQAFKNSSTKKAIQTSTTVEIDLDDATRHLAERLDFTAVWQDERKLNILKGIYHLGMVINEISSRTGIPADHIAYFEPTEALAIQNLDQLKAKAVELARRVNGVFFLQLPEGPDVAVGHDYEEAIKLYEALNGQGASKPGSSAIYGSVANPGTAIGRVVVCKDLASIDKVQEGDVLVASMTRPEYMAAIKKAAAIVTDEGGITCHAAIVARELGIPCVIGTKVATKVFKDGMIVEVRANHGMVKQI
ncbi:MAG: PEP-utilizing enzyme [Patescibacteria group bacterium]